jgi:trehalose-6-phosphate synthase
VTLVQYALSCPARQTDWLKSRSEVESIVNRINSSFGTDTVVYKEVASLSLDQRLSLWSLSDVFLSTCLRSGLSLYPMEFVVANENSEGGILILSEFSGVSRVLNGAIIVNPWMQDAVVSAIHR